MISSLTYVFVAVVGYCPTGACLGQGRLVRMCTPFWRETDRFVLRFDRGHDSLGKINRDCRNYGLMASMAFPEEELISMFFISLSPVFGRRVLIFAIIVSASSLL